MSYTQLIICPRLKHKVDKYVRYVNFVNVVLFAKTSIGLNWKISLGKLLSVIPSILNSGGIVQTWFLKKNRVRKYNLQPEAIVISRKKVPTWLFISRQISRNLDNPYVTITTQCSLPLFPCQQAHLQMLPYQRGSGIAHLCKLQIFPCRSSAPLYMLIRTREECGLGPHITSGRSRISPRWGRQLSRGGNIRFCQNVTKTA